MINRTLKLASALSLALLVLAGCKEPPVERIPMETVQHGVRGTGMVQVYNPRILATQDALNTGVTCYTCHRGNPVPTQVWFTPLAQHKGADFVRDKAGQNTLGKYVNLPSLPANYFPIK